MCVCVCTSHLYVNGDVRGEFFFQLLYGVEHFSHSPYYSHDIKKMGNKTVSLPK